MTDPSTGTPLTRRAARAAAEREAARRLDAPAGASQPRGEMLPATAVLPIDGSAQTRAHIAIPPHTPSRRPEGVVAPHAADVDATSDEVALRTTQQDAAARLFRPAVRVGAVAQLPGSRASDVQLLGEDDADILSDAVIELRVASRRKARRTQRFVAVAAAAALLLGGGAAAAAAAVGGASNGDPEARAVVASSPSPSHPAAQRPTPTAVAAGSNDAQRVTDLCAKPAFAAALKARNSDAAVKAAGGGEAFRAAVVAGTAPCVHLNDPAFTWVVVNKKRPYKPKSYAPAKLAMPAGVRSIAGGALRSDAAAALSSLVRASRQAGAGEIALDSGYRSYSTQVQSYGVQVANRGTDGADIVSARPGFSEHQSGLAGDVVACRNGSCGNLDMLAGTPQDRFILAHGWQYGWIVRYESGRTPVTGYKSEPWHLRYIGVELAKAYHKGGFHTLEQFFGLPAAPHY